MVRIIKNKHGQIIFVPDEMLDEVLKVEGNILVDETEVVDDKFTKMVSSAEREDNKLICPICGYVAQNKRALHMHKYAKHRIKRKRVK